MCVCGYVCIYMKNTHEFILILSIQIQSFFLTLFILHVYFFLFTLKIPVLKYINIIIQHSQNNNTNTAINIITEQL